MTTATLNLIETYEILLKSRNGVISLDKSEQRSLHQ